MTPQAGNSWIFLIVLVVFILLMYFMTVRPMNKQMKEHNDMMATLEPGARVVFGAGLIGTIRFLGDTQAVIELSPGVEVTVLKGAIKSIIDAEQEEFEYDPNSTATSTVSDNDLGDIEFSDPDSGKVNADDNAEVVEADVVDTDVQAEANGVDREK